MARNLDDAPQRYASDVQLAKRYSVSRPTIWRWQAAGKLPRPVRLSTGCTRWRLDDIERHEAELEQRGEGA